MASDLTNTADFENYINNYRGFTDFNVIQFGFRKCEPGFAPLPFTRKTYLIHYVYEGSGYLETDDGIFPVQKGQAFMIFPNQLTTYTASMEDPFTYRWVEFYGDKSEELMAKAGLSPKKPIFIDNSVMKTGHKLKNIVDGGLTGPFELLSKFCSLAQSLCKPSEDSDPHNFRYVEKAINYILYRSNAKLTVNEVAAYLNVSRPFLSTLFSKTMGVSMKRYILDLSMESAVTMLKNKRLSISDIADFVGYNSTEEFSKAFKRYFNVSPSAYRKKLLNNHPEIN